jgi:uncharacterized protein
MIDFFQDVIGLHVNGRAQIVPDDQIRAEYAVPVPDVPGRVPERWVRVSVQEAYIHCAKHIPRLAKLPRRRHWGTDDAKRKGGDFFGVQQARSAGATGAAGARATDAAEERPGRTPDAQAGSLGCW